MPTTKRPARRFVALDLKKAAEKRGIYKIIADSKMSSADKLKELNTIKYLLMLSKTRLSEKLDNFEGSPISKEGLKISDDYNMVFKLEKLIDLEIKKLKKTK